MAKQVKRRRGTTAEHTTFAGVEGEITVDTDKQTIVVHNGTAPGKYLMREDASNMPANSVGIVELNVTDGDADDFLQTDGNNNLSFQPIDVAGSTIGAVGGDISGTIANALIRDNKVGVAELAVTEAGGGGSAGHFLKTDGAGTLSFAAVVTDPTMGGDVGGTTSASVIQTGAVEGSMLDPALKQFTEDATGEVPVGGYNSVPNAAFPAGDGTVDTFTLSVATVPANNSLIVSIDGVMQPTSAYSFPTTTSIKFDDAPPDGSQIRILHMGFQVTVATPADGAITSIKLGGSAVTSTKLASSPTIDANRAVTTDHIKDNAITAAKIATDTITAAEIAAGTITGTQISNASITGLDIQANAIDGSHISIGTDQGDMMYYNGTNWLRLAYGTATHVLTTGGSGANPYWAAGSSGTALPSVGSSGNVLTSDGSNWASQPHASSGGVKQIKSRRSGVYSSAGPLPFPVDDTIPQWAEVRHRSELDRTFTPTSASSRLLILASVMVNSTGGGSLIYFTLHQDSGPAIAIHDESIDGHYSHISLQHDMASPGTSAVTFQLGVTGESGTIYVNGDGGRMFGGVADSCLTVIEYTP